MIELSPYILLGILEGLVIAAVLALMAVGLNIVFGVLRIINIAHGEFFMLGAVIAWLITDSVMSVIGGQGIVSFALALLLTPLLVGVLAVLADRLILKRINYDPQRTIIATIGLLYSIQQLTLMGFGATPRAVPPPFNSRIEIPWIQWRGSESQGSELQETGFAIYWPVGLATTSYKLAVIAVAALVLLAIWLVITRSKIGLIMRATQFDRDTAAAMGINVGRVYTLVFASGAALAGLAAVLIVPIRQAHYLMGQEALLLSFIVVIIGGLGSFVGTIIAAILIGLSEGLTSIFFTPTLAKIISMIIVIFILILKPDGLSGRK